MATVACDGSAAFRCGNERRPGVQAHARVDRGGPFSDTLRSSRPIVILYTAPDVRHVDRRSGQALAVSRGGPAALEAGGCAPLVDAPIRSSAGLMRLVDRQYCHDRDVHVKHAGFIEEEMIVQAVTSSPALMAAQT